MNERMVDMKVTFVAIQYPPTIGGLQAHLKGIVDLVKSMGYETFILTSKPNPTMKIDGNVDGDVIQLPVIKWFKDSPIIDPIKTYRALTKINPDVVHVVYPFPLSLDVACIYAYLHRKKLVCTYIGDVVLEFPYSMIIKVYEKIFWKLCKRVIKSISANSREYGVNAAGLKDWRKDFYDIPPPVFDTDFNLTLNKKYDSKKRLGLDSYDKIVLFVGGLRKRLIFKRPDLLLRAWSKYIKETEDKSVLLLIGDGELTSCYKDIASELGLTTDNTIFKGYVSKETLVDCYLAGDVLVMPSQDNNESFGITPVEAMLYGNAVIASDIPGIRGAVGRKNAHVSLVPPLYWERIVDELKYWLSKDLSEYALGNHEYVKECFNKESIKEEIRRMYNE